MRKEWFEYLLEQGTKVDISRWINFLKCKGFDVLGDLDLYVELKKGTVYKVNQEIQYNKYVKEVLNEWIDKYGWRIEKEQNNLYLNFSGGNGGKRYLQDRYDEGSRVIKGDKLTKREQFYLSLSELGYFLDKSMGIDSLMRDRDSLELAEYTVYRTGVETLNGTHRKNDFMILSNDLRKPILLYLIKHETGGGSEKQIYYDIESIRRNKYNKDIKYIVGILGTGNTKSFKRWLDIYVEEMRNEGMDIEIVNGIPSIIEMIYIEKNRCIVSKEGFKEIKRVEIDEFPCYLDVEGSSRSRKNYEAVFYEREVSIDGAVYTDRKIEVLDERRYVEFYLPGLVRENLLFRHTRNIYINHMIQDDLMWINGE